MRRRAFKIEAVARLQAILLAIKRDLQFAAKNVNELFPFVRIRISAAGFGRNAKQVRLHHCIAPRQQFHTNTYAGFQNLAIGSANLPAAGAVGIEEIENVRLVELRQLAEGANGAAHLGPFHGAEKSHGDADSVCDLRERELTAGPQVSPRGPARPPAALPPSPHHSFTPVDMY